MSSVGKSKDDLINEVDPVTRARIASLCARGLTDFAVSDILYLSVEHIAAVKETEEYKVKYCAEADRIIQEQIDRDEGWDGLETSSLEGLLQTLRFNKDPKFLLSVAAVANRAERRAKNKKTDPTVVDATQQPQGAKIIVLNRYYINNRAGDGALDISARPKEIEMKKSDVPAPKLVDEFLAPARERANLTKPKEEDEIERLFRESGVVFDKEYPNGS